jgi:predicted flap endonuclease-1-like 5' DNA nuclease
MIIALVSFATALVTGVLLGKAFFTAQTLSDSISREVHHESLSMQRKRYRHQLLTLHNKAQKKLIAQRKKIADQGRQIKAVRSEPRNGGSVKEFYDGKLVESLRVEIVVLRENLEARDERLGELNLELRESQVRAQELLNNLNAWKNRVGPLTKKLHEQRTLIDGITGSQSPSEPAEFNPRTGKRPDDLKKIRGIGPALERRLHTTGVSQFRQIAEMSAQDLSDLAGKISISPAVAERGKWIQQARTLQDLANSSIQTPA